ncbi:MAG: HU family DNA-binding protein [Bacteroidales bacterium]|nr:HU family DNA-binding protein [Bacteroidales bacterium]
MNNKLTILDIAESVADKSGLTKKESEQFVKEFFLLASEVISKGESLTIKGVGTFSPVWVDARTSVDVNTKESIEIPGHYKLSFTPDKSMRDAVNAPFAAFTTEVVTVNNDDLQEDNSQLTNIETNEESVESVVAQIEEIGKASEETLIEVEKVSVVQSGDVVEENEEVVDDSNEIQGLENNISTEETQNDDAVIEVVEKEIEKEYRRHTRNGYISGFLTALLLFVIFIFIWKFFIDNEKGFSLSFSSFNLSSLIEQNSDIDTESDNISKNNADISVVNPIDSIGDVKAEDVIKSEVVDSVNVVEDEKPKEPIVETITRGKFLTTIANKYYGDKVFWVYIYRENKIWNPKDLQPGDKVVVPDASKYDIDASNPESVKKAKALEQQILYEIE